MVYILGIGVMAIGFAIIWKTESMLRNFGRIGFFDRYLGTEGGSRMGYKIIGIAIIFIGLMMATGTIDNFLAWLLGPFIRMMNMQPI